LKEVLNSTLYLKNVTLDYKENCQNINNLTRKKNYPIYE